MSDHHPIDPDANRCPRCMQRYDFWTDGFGRVIGPFHPLGDCNARPEPPGQKHCIICGGVVPVGRPGYGYTCSPEHTQLYQDMLKEARKLVSRNKSKAAKQERMREQL